MQGDDRLDRLLAEVAAGPRVDGRARAHAATGGPAGRRRRRRRGSRGRAARGAKRAAEPIIAALSVQSSQRDQLQPHAALLAERRHRLAQRPVGGDAAAQRDRLPLAALQRPLQLRGQLADRRRLEARREVGAALLDPLGAEVAAEVDQRRLQAAEAEVEPGVAAIATGISNASGSPSAASRSSAGPPGIAEPEHARDLVEGLAGGVVEGLAEHLVAVVVAHRGEQGVAAAGDQAEERRLERLGLEEVGGDVALQVVDRDQRQPPRRGDRLRGADADQQRPDQARAGGDRDRLDLVERRRRPRPARPRPPARPARGGGGRRPRARRRRSARAPRPARRSRWRGSAGRRATAAQVSSQEVSIARITTQSSHMISASSPLSW